MWRTMIASFALLTACERAPSQPVYQTTPVYQRAGEIMDDADLKARMSAYPAHVQELEWMEGVWNVDITVYATAGSPERREHDKATFKWVNEGEIASENLDNILVYDAFAERWRTAGFEPPLAPMTTQLAGAPWDGRRLIFEGDVTLLGERYWLRQTLTKISDIEFVLLNEQRVGENRFIRVDEYHYRRDCTTSVPQTGCPP